MKKLFSLLAMAAMVFTACQNDEGVKNPTLADEGIVNLSVGVPELATRALDGDNQSGADSAYGAIDYANYTAFLEKNYDVRFQMAVYEAGAAEDAEPIYTATNYVDFASTTNFNDLRFVPGREYQFVIFADFVKQGTQVDFRYNTADLRNITSFEPLNAMDETYDAYFFNETIKVEAGKVNELQATLKRPFGKIRVLTTDLEWVENYAVPAEGTVTFYNHAIYKSFNALTGEVSTEATNDEESLTYAINQEYYGATKYEGKNAATLFATYILGNEWQEAVNFRLDTFEKDGSLIKSLDFNTEIPYQRNHLTTLVGNLLTNEADLTILIDDNFDAEEFIGGDFENVENDLKWVREGELVGGQVYKYETNLFSFRLLSETDGTDLREGKYDYTEELPYIQNATGFDIQGVDVEKGSLEIIKRGTRAGNFYDVVFDIYATIDGKTENYILTWTGELKAPRTPLAEPVVTYEVDEVEALYITFSWEAVEGAKNYTVEWNGEKQTVEGTSVTFDFAGVDTKATAYVTANPEFTWSNTASTGSVLVDWKAPITYTEVAVDLQYVKGTEVAFATEGLTIYFEKYPSFDGAWYQATGELPKVFSADATVEETTGSAAQVVITDPAIATKFIYTGAMNPYILTKAEVNWLAGYNTVKVKFSNEAGDAIEFQTTAPMEAGKATIEPTYVAIAGDQAGNIKEAEMNVLLENGEYTIFFTIESALNDILMQYVGAIDFVKPYTPDYVLNSYTAGAETINFVGEGVEFEIKATSLESGDVVVTKYVVAGTDFVKEGATVTAVATVTEEDGIYDARYVVSAGNSILTTVKNLQYVGPFKAYEATPEPAKPIEFTATYEQVGTAYLFTGVNYNFSILVNKLGNTEYITGDTEDAWAYDWTKDQPMNNFRTGDFLTVENNVVTVEFTAAPFGQELRYKMTCNMNPAVQEPEDIYLRATVNGTVYSAVEDDYMIDYTDGYANAYYQGKLMGGVTVDVADGADDIEFTFFHEERNAYIHITYDKIGVTPAQELKIDLQFDGTIYTYTFENGYKYVFDTVEGKVVYVAPNGEAPEATFEYTLVESATVDTYTFQDTLNNYNVTATYKKGETLVADLELKSWKQGPDVGDNGIKFNAYVDANNINDNYVEVVVNTTDATNNSIAEGTYTHTTGWPYELKNIFALSAYKIAGARVTKSNIPEGQMIVVKNGENYDITIVAGEFVAHYFGTIGEATVTPEPDQPGTDEPEQPTYEELNLTATYNGTDYEAGEYILIEGKWSNTTLNKMGTYEETKTEDGIVFTFTDTNYTPNRKVTVTYTEKSTEPDYSNWVTGVKTDGSNMTFTGATGTMVGKLGKFALGTTTFTEVKLDGTAVNAEGTVNIALGNGDYIATLEIVIDGVTYGGSAHFNI